MDIDWESFFELHKDLPREGPGEAEEVAWAVSLAGLPQSPRICDAGCGPGGDIAALLDAAPGAQVLGVDKTAAFVAQAQARFASDPRVRSDEGDMAALPDAPFDMIWCAGALYFLGLQEGLRTMRDALVPGGVLAFSEPCFFTDTPSAAALAFWEGYPTRPVAQILSEVADARFEVLGHRPVSDAGWEAYFGPMEARIAGLRPKEDDRLGAMLDYCAQEAASWRSLRHETGYLLTVARVS